MTGRATDRRRVTALLRAAVYGPVAAGVVWALADQVWPEYSLRLALGLLPLVLGVNAVLLLRARRDPAFAGAVEGQVRTLQAGVRYGPLARGCFGLLALVFAASSAWFGLFLVEAPDFWILSVPLLAGSILMTVAFGYVALSGRGRGLPGLLP